MTPKFDLFVFDWDGTLMDTTGAIAEGIVYAFEKVGYAHPGIEATKRIIGTDWMRAIYSLVPDFRSEDYEVFEAAYREKYIAAEREIKLFDGMRELLEAMNARGLPCAIATGKSRRGMKRVFELTGIGHLFVDTVTADEARAKPDPMMLELLAERNGVDIGLCVMIGDTAYDIEMAKAAGAACVTVSFGAYPREELARHHVPVADTVEELKSHLGLDDIL